MKGLKNLFAPIILLISILVGSQNAYSQNTITIGNGNTSVSEKYPFNGYFDFGWSNIIYKASEINQAGQISKVAFYINNAPSNYVMNSQKIYVRHTSQNGYTTSNYPGISGYTLVFDGTITYNGSGWKELVFSTPFSYNGIDNLEFLFENRDGSYANGFPNFMLTTNIGENRIRRDYKDYSFPSTSNYASMVNAIVNIRLTINECSLNSGNISASPSSITPGGTSTVTINGQDPSASIQWQFSSDNTAFSSIIGANSASYQTPALTSSTFYRALLNKNGCFKNSNTLQVNIDTTNLISQAIGSGTSNFDKYPFYNFYEYSWSSMIYKAYEINSTGKLTHLSFFVDNASKITAKNQKIYARHTKLDEYKDGVYPTTAGFTLIYDGSITYNGSGWKEIVLSSLFDYNGVDNLEFLFENRDGTYTMNYPVFKGDANITEFRVKRDFKDGVFPSACTYCNRYKNVLNVKMKFLPCNISAGVVKAENNSIQTGKQINLSINGQTNGSTIQWQKSTDNVNYFNIAGAVSSNYSEIMSTLPVWFRTVTTNNCSKFSNSQKIEPDTCFSQVITIGDSISATEKFPFNNYYDFSWSNFIYKSNEVGEAGKITSVSFYVQNNPINVTANNQKIYVRHSNTIGYSNGNYPTTTGYTLVFDGTIVFNGSGWKEIPFNTFFDYNGTDNLEFLIENHDGSWISSYPIFRFTSGQTEFRVRRDYKDGNFPSSCYLCNRFQNLPNIQIKKVQPGLDAGNNVEICKGNTQLNATGGTNYLWTPTVGLNDPNISNPFASPEITTIYTVTTTLSNGCHVKDSVIVTLKSPECKTWQALVSTVDVTSEQEGSAVVDIVGNFIPNSFHWYSIDSLIDSTYIANLAGLNTGNYWVVIKDSLGDSISVPFAIGQEIFWTYQKGVAFNRELVTKTGVDGWVDGVIQSHNKINAGENGRIEFEANEKAGKYAVGLRDFNTTNTNGYSGLKYGYILNNGSIGIYENGVLISTTKTYDEKDKLSVERKGSQIRYLKNEELLRTSNLTENEVLSIHAGIYENGKSIKIKKWISEEKLLSIPSFNSKVVNNLSCGEKRKGSIQITKTGGFLYTNYNYEFRNRDNVIIQSSGVSTINNLDAGWYTVKVTANRFFGSATLIRTYKYWIGYDIVYKETELDLTVQGRKIIKTGNYPNGQKGGYASVNELSAGKDGWFYLKLSRDYFQKDLQTGKEKSKFIGLSSANTDGLYSSINYAFEINATTLELSISENGIKVPGPLPFGGFAKLYAGSDDIAISRDGSVLKYWYNGSVLRTLNVDPNTKLLLDGVLNYKGGYFENVLSSFCVDSCFVSVVSPEGALTVCAWDSLQLNASGANLFSWVPQVGLSCYDCKSPVFVSDTTITYTLYGYTDSIARSLNFSCGKDSITIKVNPLPPGGMMADGYGCVGDTLHFSAFTDSLNSYTYLWSPNSCIPDSTNPSVSVVLANGCSSFDVTITSAEGCSSRNQYGYRLNQKPEIRVTDITICSGQEALLHADSESSSNLINWFQDSVFIGMQGKRPIIVTPITTTSYIVKVTSDRGCVSFDTLTVTVIPDSFIEAGADVIICQGDSIQINATGATSYSWSPALGLSATDGASVIASPMVTTTYYVTTGNSSSNNQSIISDFEIASPFQSYLPLASSACMLYNSASYQLTSSPPHCENIFTGEDHTNPGKGKYYLGASLSGALLKHAVSVSPNQNYSIAIWYMNPIRLSNLNIDGKIMVNINSVDVEVRPIPQNRGVWERLELNWNSGNSTTAEINLKIESPDTKKRWIAFDDYSFSGVDRGCGGTDSVTVFVQPKPSAGNDTTVCFGTQLQLNGTGSLSYNWFPSAGLSDSTIPNPVVTIDRLGDNDFVTYYFIASDTLGCFDGDTVSVSIEILENVFSVMNDQAICFGDQTIIATDGEGIFTWSPSIGLSDATSPEPVASPLITTTYYVQYQDTMGCYQELKYDSVTIVVNPLPASVLSQGLSICQGQETQLTATGNNLIFEWFPIEAIADANVSSPKVTPQVTTTYWLAISDTNSCKDTLSTTVTVIQLPVISVTKDTSVCAGSDVQLQASGGVSYQWQPENSLNNPVSASPVLTANVELPCEIIFSSLKVSSNKGNFFGSLNKGDKFGASLTSIADLNGDGVREFVVGAPFDDNGYELSLNGDNGAIWILMMNSNGTVQMDREIGYYDMGYWTADSMRVNELERFDMFGTSVSLIGDLNNDGTDDIIVGAPGDDTLNVSAPGMDMGAAYIIFLEENTASVKSYQKIAFNKGGFTGSLSMGDGFGHGVAGLGDLDGDGVKDVAVGAIGDSEAGIEKGAVWILFLNSNGTVKTHQKINALNGGFTGVLNEGDHFGSKISNIGDIDNDGVIDIAVSATGDDDGGLDHGAVWILFMNSNGTVKASQKISNLAGNFAGTINDGETFGADITGLGDINNDGVKDIAVGHRLQIPGIGKTWLLHLNSNGTVNNQELISENKNGFDGDLNNNDQFGASVAAIGDFFGDGKIDLIIGAPQDNDGGAYKGAFWILNINYPCQSSNKINYEVSVTGSNGCVAKESVNITIKPTPDVVAIEDNTACLGEKVQLIASGALTYEWSPTVGLSNPNLSNPIATITSSSVFYVTGTDAIGCSGTDTITITAPVIPFAGNDTSICFRDNLQLHATGGVSYQWFPSQGLSDASIANPIALIGSSITYYIQVTDANNCVDTIDITVAMDEACRCNLNPGSGITYTWSGAVSSNWADPLNWSPNGIPGTSVTDNVIIINGPSVTKLDIERTIHNICVLSGELNLGDLIIHVEGDGTYTGGKVTGNGNDIDIAPHFASMLLMDRSNPTLLQTAYFGGTEFTSPVRVEKCNEIYLNGSVFNRKANFNQTGVSLVECKGGNVYNDDTKILNTGGGIWKLASLIGGSADTYNANVTFENNGNGKLYPTALYSESFKGDVEIVNDNIVFGQNGGEVVFNNYLNQHITGSGLPSDPIIKKLKINKTISSNLILNIPVTIGNASGDYITFTNGLIETSLTNLLTINNGVIVNTPSNESFVAGPLKKIGNEDFIFPVGKGSAYTPIAISGASLVDPSETYIAEFIDHNQTLGSFIAPLQHISTCSYWTLKRLGGGNTTTKVSLLWHSYTCDITNDLTKMHVAGWNGTNWKSHGNGSYTGSKLAGGTVTSAENIGTFNAFIIGSDIIPGNDPTTGLSFNNYGANVHVSSSQNLNVYGNVLNEKGSLQEKGVFSNAGTIKVLNDWTNNVDNFAFDVLDGDVELFGSYQRIRGTDATQYFNLKAAGHGKKEMFVDANAGGKLDLTENQLETRKHTFYVNTPDVTSVLRTDGFVSSKDGGFLSREMNSSSMYLFPVGAYQKYRPLEITPSSANSHIYKVRMDDEDPTDDGFDRAIKTSDLQIINDKYYHWVERTSGSDPAKLEIYFNGNEEGQFQNIGHWDDQPVGPTAFLPNPPLWKRTSNFTLTQRSLPLLSSVAINNWNDYTHPQFSLVRAGFIINTGGFGNPGGTTGGGVTYTMGGDGFNGNGPTYGTGSGTGNPDGSGGNTVTPDDLVGTHTMLIDGGPYNTGGGINITVNNDGNITELGFVDENGDVNTLATDLYEIINGNILVLNSEPKQDIFCDGNIRIQLNSIDKTVLYKSLGDHLVVSGVNTSDPSLKLEIKDRSGNLIITRTGSAVTGSPWGAGGSPPGVYTYELTVSVVGGGPHTFKGQFFVEQ